MKSMLVVDDNELVRNLIEVVLKEAGLEVLTAASGAEALELMSTQSSTIACLLQDLSMPVMPGHEVVTEVHKIEPDLPVIILTVDDPAQSASRNRSRIRATNQPTSPMKPRLTRSLAPSTRE